MTPRQGCRQERQHLLAGEVATLLDHDDQSLLAGIATVLRQHHKIEEPRSCDPYHLGNGLQQIAAQAFRPT